LIAALSLTAKRAAAARHDVPPSTAATIRLRISNERGAAIAGWPPLPALSLNHTSDLKGIPAESGKVEFALVLTDPPYGINLDYNSYTDTEDNWFRLMTAAIPEMTRVAIMVIFPACKQSRLRWYFENFPPNWI